MYVPVEKRNTARYLPTLIILYYTILILSSDKRLLNITLNKRKIKMMSRSWGFSLFSPFLTRLNFCTFCITIMNDAFNKHDIDF